MSREKCQAMVITDEGETISVDAVVEATVDPSDGREWWSAVLEGPDFDPWRWLLVGAGSFKLRLPQPDLESPQLV